MSKTEGRSPNMESITWPLEFPEGDMMEGAEMAGETVTNPSGCQPPLAGKMGESLDTWSSSCARGKGHGSWPNWLGAEAISVSSLHAVC